MSTSQSTPRYINRPEAAYLPRFEGVSWLPKTPVLESTPGRQPTANESEIMAIAAQLRDTPEIMLDAVDSLLSYYELNTTTH